MQVRVSEFGGTWVVFSLEPNAWNLQRLSAGLNRGPIEQQPGHLQPGELRPGQLAIQAGLGYREKSRRIPRDRRVVGKQLPADQIGTRHEAGDKGIFKFLKFLLERTGTFIIVWDESNHAPHIHGQFGKGLHRRHVLAGRLYVGGGQGETEAAVSGSHLGANQPQEILQDFSRAHELTVKFELACQQIVLR